MSHIKLQQIQIPKILGVLGDGMVKNNAMLAQTLKTTIKRYYPSSVSSAQTANLPDALIGWGNKKSFQRAKIYGKNLNLPVFSVEDGFIRSLDTGTHSRHALSLIIDDLGIYFDLTQTSRLEKMILARLTQEHWSPRHYHYAKQFMQTITEQNLSKYNATIDCPNLAQLTFSPEHVLIIDQVAGDNSIIGAGLSPETARLQFIKMLTDACKNHPKANIWIKAHPAGKGYLAELDLAKIINSSANSIYILDEQVNPILLLKQVQHVYTVSSHMGFEALILSAMGDKKIVHCYGVNWYSAWGLTDDSGVTNGDEKLQQLYRQVKNRRFQKPIDIGKNEIPFRPLVRRELHPKASHKNTAITEESYVLTEGRVWEGIAINVEQLFFSAYLDYSHYADPATKESCDIDTAISWLLTNRHWHNQLKGKLTIYEFSRWKLPFVRAFVGFPETELFIKPRPRWKNYLHPNHFLVNLSNPLLTWGLENYQKLTVHDKVHKIYCMEDGFIRSNGLGATLIQPLSVVIDRQGIYYNATKPSDLETLLKNCPKLSQAEITRVQNLQKRLLKQKVSKYNVGTAEKSNQFNKLEYVASKKILIVGQVEDDLSVQYCGSKIKRNSDLIKQVKKDNPYAYLIYKPHPDVEAGLRAGKIDKYTLSQVDMVAHDIAMPDCLQVIDEVHTISSLTGFEALLRDKLVICYGLPFYAGWGLTIDKTTNYECLKRREREQKLSLEQLIYCTLIKYPLYHLPDGYGLAQVEQVIDYLYPTNPQEQAKIQKVSKKQELTQTAKTNFMKVRHKLLSLKK